MIESEARIARFSYCLFYYIKKFCLSLSLGADLQESKFFIFYKIKNKKVVRRFGLRQTKVWRRPIRP